MVRRTLISNFLKIPRITQPSSFFESSEKGKNKTLGRKTVQILLISLTGGVALSALDDLAIYHACSSKAMEKASQSQEIVNAIGKPVVKGPWYNSSLAVAHKRHSVSCTFPISGPRGTGVFQLKAIRNGDDTWFSFLRPRDWNVLVMEALLHVPENEEKDQTLRISLSNSITPPASKACTECNFQQSGSPDKRWLDEQKKLANVSPEAPVYISLRMDGRVRGSGVGYPPWNAFVAQLPPVKGLWSGLLDGMDGRVL